MFLEMYIRDMLIDRALINFDHCPTVSDREALLMYWVITLRKKHFHKIRESNDKPVFFLDHVPSKMNFSEFQLK